MFDKLFLCIGAQKAGTTWLFSVLMRDERLARCQFTKEVHYFDWIHNDYRLLNIWRAEAFLDIAQRRGKELRPAITAWLSGQRSGLSKTLHGVEHAAIVGSKLELLLNEVNDNWYSRLLQKRDNQEWSMDITPDYAVIGKKGFLHCNQIARKLRLLFILRNPVERAWSGLLESKKGSPGGIKAYLESNINNVDLMFRECVVPKGVVQPRTDYLTTLDNLKEAALLDKLLIKFYDDLKSDARSFIVSIYDHLNLDASPITLEDDVLHTRVYETTKNERPPELEERLREHYRSMVRSINEHYVKVPSSWMDYFSI